MKKSDMLFAILRKSLAVLKDLVSTTADRRLVIQIKYEYSKLDNTLRNLMRLMATDIDRFEIVDCTKQTITNTLLGTTDVIPKMIDTKTGTTFSIFKEEIKIDSIVAFTDVDFKAFVVAYSCLATAKEHQVRTMEEYAISEKRLSALSEYR